MRFILIVIFTTVVSGAGAHEAHSGFKYARYCCNGDSQTGDCQTIPMRAVTIAPGGYIISLGPGDHRLVTRNHVFNWSQDQTRRSEDGEYHLCLFPNEDTPRCFYAPDMGY